MFRLNRNERSHWSGNGVHVESELVFMIGRNMHCSTPSGGKRLWGGSNPSMTRLMTCTIWLSLVDLECPVTSRLYAS